MYRYIQKKRERGNDRSDRSMVRNCVGGPGGLGDIGTYDLEMVVPSLLCQLDPRTDRSTRMIGEGERTLTRALR